MLAHRRVFLVERPLCSAPLCIGSHVGGYPALLVVSKNLELGLTLPRRLRFVPGLFSLATADASLLVNWMRDYLLLALLKFGAALKLHAMLSRLLHPGHTLEQRRGIHCVNAAGAAVGSRKA